MITKKHGLLLLSSLLAMQLPLSAEVDPINFDWRFSEGSHPESIQPDFDDSEWQVLNLPHDWAIAKPFDEAGDPNTGKLEWKGEGWYRKSFELPADAKDKRLQFTFDGVMSHPTVYLNGEEVGSWVYGYNSFNIDATDAARFGESNTITVHADTREHHSRWYPGAGIYRKVSMRLVDPIHIPTWGVFITTPQVTDAAAEVQVEVDLANLTGKAATVGVESEIVSPDGVVVSTQREIVQLDANTGKATLTHTITSPKRWDIEHPYRYTSNTRLIIDSEVIHSEVNLFGIRTFEWTADDGFHLNGRRVELQGVNEHHTHGMLGAAFLPAAMERKLEILRDMGVNALRTSHNPEAPEVLEMCDRLGIVVVNELFDKWGPTAGVDTDTANFVDQHAEKEVRNFIRRDRNHPSVMLWSIANEDAALLGDWDGAAEQVTKMVEIFNKYDDTRPTTMGCHMAGGAEKEKGVFDALDTSGWNYSQRYMYFRQNYPDKPIIYSETASAFATRGHYVLELPKSKMDYGKDGYENAFVLTAAPWGDLPEPEFERMRKHRFLNGDFVWTGFDYLGEPTPNRTTNYPPENELGARSSYFGIIDLAGLPKDSFYLYRSQWNKKEHTVHLSPHWNWNEGDQVPVIVYTDGNEAELFLNGQSIARKAKDKPDETTSANLAFSKHSQASSEQVIQDAGGNVMKDNTSDKAVDGDVETLWCAQNGTFPQDFQVDLGEQQAFSYIRIHWGNTAESYQFSVYTDGGDGNWKLLDGELTNEYEVTTIRVVDASARRFKVDIHGFDGDHWAVIREFEVLNSDPARVENPYYDIVHAYRIWFPPVSYEAGELKVVAYKDGKIIGEDVVQTAGAAAQLELKADRSELKADGMDLCYVTIRMLDADGNLCPRSMNNLQFEVEGPATFMGVANGDQMGFNQLTDTSHPLFYGQAVAVLRAKPGESGTARLKVTADNDPQSELFLHFD